MRVLQDYLWIKYSTALPAAVVPVKSNDFHFRFYHKDPFFKTDFGTDEKTEFKDILENFPRLEILSHFLSNRVNYNFTFYPLILFYFLNFLKLKRDFFESIRSFLKINYEEPF